MHQMQQKQQKNRRFQWAPTLGGECYMYDAGLDESLIGGFQWAPTLGGECYML